MTQSPLKASGDSILTDVLVGSAMALAGGVGDEVEW
jgi:hypothetical protein